MPETVVFIHGMFQNAKSWDKWIPFFEQKQFDCIAESWPLHEGDPRKLRAEPPSGLGDLRLQAVIDRYLKVIRPLSEPPFVIGHSVGGLIVQKLVELNVVKAGVAICSVAPNRMLEWDWSFFRNSIEITNPFVGDRPFEMTAADFHGSFANTMERTDADIAYESYATYDSRNVLRDCLLSPGQLDLSQGTAPLLFIAAEQDQIIPPALCEQNRHACVDAGRIADYQSFPHRSHYICGEPGWEEVAGQAADWLSRFAAPSGLPSEAVVPAVR